MQFIYVYPLYVYIYCFPLCQTPSLTISKLKIVNISVAASAHSLTFHLHFLYDISQHSSLYKYIWK